MASNSSLGRRIWNNIGFLTLFTVCTSSSLNCVTLVRERKDERRLHFLQCGLLQDLRSALKEMPSYSKISLEEQKMLVRRFTSLGLNPKSIGFSQSVLPQESEEEMLRKRKEMHTTWSKALFGSGLIGKLRESLRKTFIRLRGGQVEVNTIDPDQIEKEEAEWIEALNLANATPQQR